MDLCLAELRETIETFIKGDPLKLCRNLRGEFSGIQKIECEDAGAGSDDDHRQLGIDIGRPAAVPADGLVLFCDWHSPA